MAAELIPAQDPRQPHRLRLGDPSADGSVLEEARHGLPPGGVRGPLTLEAGDWPLHRGDLEDLQALLAGEGLVLQKVSGRCRETLVAAAGLRLETEWPLERAAPTGLEGPGSGPSSLTVHHGTLRSGDHLQAKGSVLLLGDVNPGARISAGGHVLVWGRLRGMAHAGREGDEKARVVALQLRPLQLRIAGAVARGPEDHPPPGLAEEARLENGTIRIEPAAPLWPLDEAPRDGGPLAAPGPFSG